MCAQIFWHEFHIPKKYCVDTSSGSTLMCEQGLLVNVWQARMFCHIGLQAPTTEISSHMMWQSYRKMYHWQSTNVVHAWLCSGTFSHAARDVLNNTYHDRWIGRGGPTAWPTSSPDLFPPVLYLWGSLKSLMYVVPDDNGETLHHRIVDACQTIRNCPGIFARMRRSMVRRVKACVESHGGHLEHVL
jgi:hypothetical protein